MATADENDPRPVLRKELSRVFQNQRVVRAFEKIFDLVPPEFINQQVQIDTINLAAELGASQSFEAVAAITRLASAIDQLALGPPDQPSPVAADPTALVGLIAVAGVAETLMRSDAAPALDQAIAAIWTAAHTFAAAGNKVMNLDSAGETYVDWKKGGVHKAYLGLASAIFGGGSANDWAIDATTGNIRLGTGGVEAGRFDQSAVAGDTRFMLYDVTAGALVRVSRGAVDSGGVGFRLLRVPN